VANESTKVHWTKVSVNWDLSWIFSGSLWLLHVSDSSAPDRTLPNQSPRTLQRSRSSRQSINILHCSGTKLELWADLHPYKGVVEIFSRNSRRRGEKCNARWDEDRLRQIRNTINSHCSFIWESNEMRGTIANFIPSHTNLNGYVCNELISLSDSWCLFRYSVFGLQWYCKVMNYLCHPLNITRRTKIKLDIKLKASPTFQIANASDGSRVVVKK